MPFYVQDKRRLTQEQYEKDYQEVSRDNVVLRNWTIIRLHCLFDLTLIVRLLQGIPWVASLSYCG